MKKILALILAVLTVVSFSACSKKVNGATADATATPDRASITPGPQYAYDYAKMQDAYPESSVRIVEDSTTVKFTIGDKVMYGSIDNEVPTAVAFLDKLPMTVHMTRLESCLDGKLDEELEYESKNVHFGWLNGDIDYYVPNQSLQFNFLNQDFSYEDNGHVNIGSVIGNLSDWYDFSGEYDVLIEVVPIEE